MRILILGTHPHVRQYSMKLFAEWLQKACATIGPAHVYSPAPIFCNAVTKNSPLAKWLKYLDIYVVATIYLMIVQWRYDLVIAADHGNAPALSLVARARAVAMVHDAVALAPALQPRSGVAQMGASGRLLQRWIRAALNRCRLLFCNPGQLPAELRALGITPPLVVTGCPFDGDRFSSAAATGARLELPRRYFLNVGSDEPRKRKSELLRLWREVEAIDDDCHLVLAGTTLPGTRQLCRELGLRRVVVLDAVSDAALAQLYDRSAGLIVASSFEGFCIPVLEALTFGKPVFTPADTAFFVEVFGAAVRPVIGFDRAGAQALLTATGASPTEEAARAEVLRTYSMDNFTRVVTGALLNLSGTPREAAQAAAGSEIGPS